MCAPAGQPIIRARWPAEAESATRRAHTRQPLSNTRRRRRTSVRAGLFASTTEIPQQSACPPGRDTQCEGTKAVSPRHQYALRLKGLAPLWPHYLRRLDEVVLGSVSHSELPFPPSPFPAPTSALSPLLSHARWSGATAGPVSASAYHPREARRPILHSGPQLTLVRTYPRRHGRPCWSVRLCK